MCACHYRKNGKQGGRLLREAEGRIVGVGRNCWRWTVFQDMGADYIYEENVS